VGEAEDGVGHGASFASNEEQATLAGRTAEHFGGGW
jgi:hypothetical protein